MVESQGEDSKLFLPVIREALPHSAVLQSFTLKTVEISLCREPAERASCSKSLNNISGVLLTLHWDDFHLLCTGMWRRSAIWRVRKSLG